MLLNPGQISPIQGAWGNAGAHIGNGYGQGIPGSETLQQGFGPLAAFGGQGLGLQGRGNPFQAAYGGQGLGGNPIDDAADDIADRISSEIADQSASAAAALFQAQNQQQQQQPLAALNVKRWLHVARSTDAARDQVKQTVHHLCRQTISQLLNLLQMQASGAAQQFGQLGQLGTGQQQYGQPFGQQSANPMMAAAAFGGGQTFGQQPFGQQNVAQLAPVVASILGMLQSHAQTQGQPQFGSGRLG